MNNNVLLEKLFKELKRRKLKEEKKEIKAERLAKYFHDTYEKLAPQYSYKTRKESAVDWKDVPKNNKELMIAVAEKVIKEFIEE